MTQENNAQRYKTYKYWESLKHQPYDFEEHGILTKYASPTIFKTKNIILKKVLYIYEQALIMMNKYIDLLNNCHNYLKWNR